MKRALLVACGVAFAAALDGCSRVDSSRHNPVEEPLYQANDGDAAAQYEVGVRIVASPASAPDYAQAARWFRRAADQGHAGAQAALGVMYHRGQGIARNDIEAVKWLSLATWQNAAERDAHAMWREYVARQMNSADVTEAERLAREWRRPS